jgi:hypothetical protein
LELIEPLIFLLLVADVGPYRLLVAPHRIDEVSSGPEVLPDELALPFPAALFGKAVAGDLSH